MSLKIINVKESGILQKERLILQALEDCNLKDFAIHDTTYANDKLSNELEHFFPLPNCPVKKGDYVSIYTKKGKNSKKDKTHFIYWGVNETIWNKGGDVAYVMKMEIVDSKAV